MTEDAKSPPQGDMPVTEEEPIEERPAIDPAMRFDYFSSAVPGARHTIRND